MTPTAFANLLGARPAGRGRWQAHCPAHRDRSPSLTVTAGDQGRVLVRCWSRHCEPKAIVAALGLTMRDLFSDAPMNPRARERAREEALEREAAERAEAKAERRANSIHRRLGYVVDSLAAKLARLPDGQEGDALASVFHAACRWQAEVESSLGTYGAVKTPPIQAGLASSPFSGHPQERLEAERVAAQAQLLQYVGTGEAGPVLAMKPERERPSAWRWVPTRRADAAVIDILYEAAVDALNEVEALRGQGGEAGGPPTNESPVASGALLTGAA